jgi:hypothetical protein
MHHPTCNDHQPVIEKCKGCSRIIKRVNDQVEICCFTVNPEMQWFWFEDLNYPCPRATHYKQEEDFFW